MSKESSAQQVAEHLEHFITYISSPWRMVWVNFLAGAFRGLGAMIGAGLVLAILLWILSIFADLPLIGEYIKNIKKSVDSYMVNTDYKSDLSKIHKTLEKIEIKISN